MSCVCEVKLTAVRNPAIVNYILEIHFGNPDYGITAEMHVQPLPRFALNECLGVYGFFMHLSWLLFFYTGSNIITLLIRLPVLDQTLISCSFLGGGLDI